MDEIRMDLQLFSDGAAGAGASGGAGDGGAAGGVAAGADALAGSAADGGEEGAVVSAAEVLAELHAKQEDDKGKKPRGKAKATKAPASPDAGLTGAEPDGQQGQPNEPGQDDAQRRADFEKYITENKDLYDERVQGLIRNRLRDHEQLEKRATEYGELADVLAAKYGVESADANAIMKAIEEDRGFYQDAAERAGMTVEQYRENQRIMRENAQLRREMQQVHSEQQRHEALTALQQQEAGMKQFYPNFSLDAEAQLPTWGRFRDLMTKNMLPMREAYELIHRDDIIGGAVQYAYTQTQQKVVNDIRTRAARPSENGIGQSAPAAQPRIDPAKLSREERRAINERVMNGERVSF